MDKLEQAVKGDIPEDRNMWRINWLKSLLAAIDGHELEITDECEDPDSLHMCLQECRDMVRDVNAALSD